MDIKIDTQKAADAMKPVASVPEGQADDAPGTEKHASGFPGSVLNPMKTSNKNLKVFGIAAATAVVFSTLGFSGISYAVNQPSATDSTQRSGTSDESIYTPQVFSNEDLNHSVLVQDSVFMVGLVQSDLDLAGTYANDDFRAEYAAIAAEAPTLTDDVLLSQKIARLLEMHSTLGAAIEQKAIDEAEALAREAEYIAMHEPIDGVEWGTSREAFVAVWAPRINDYLSGHGLEGTGEIFANVSWETGVDPRWSPAISCIESTKGDVCFRPYNAWGWMSSSGWSSWEEAIRTHINGLKKGYGITVSESAAQKYCPPTWSSWYSKVVREMSKI